MKNLWHHNYTKMTSLYYKLSKKFEISPTFLIYFERNLMGIIFIILVLRLLKRNVFIYQKREEILIFMNLIYQIQSYGILVSYNCDFAEYE